VREKYCSLAEKVRFMLGPGGPPFSGSLVSTVTEDLIGTGSHAALPAFHARQRSFTARIPEELTQLLEVKAIHI